MEDLVKFFSLTIDELIDMAFHAPFWALQASTIAVALASVVIFTLASTSGERLKAVVYIAVGLILYIEILRPVGWLVFLG